MSHRCTIAKDFSVSSEGGLDETLWSILSVKSRGLADRLGSEKVRSPGKSGDPGKTAGRGASKEIAAHVPRVIGVMIPPSTCERERGSRLEAALQG